MARKGRDLEQLIKVLERLLSNGDEEVVIKSPDYISDIHSGEAREVDVSLRRKVGSHDILIILECRKRKSRGDVTWIEQIANKRISVGASKAVAISQTGFTKGAKSKAQVLNVELRTLDQLTLEDINNWFLASSVYLWKNIYQIIAANLELANPNENLRLNSTIEIKTNENLFVNSKGDKFSLENIVLEFINQHPNIYDDIPPNYDPVSRLIHIDLIDVFLVWQEELYRVSKALLSIKLWTELKEIPPSSILQYTKPDGLLAQTVSFEMDINDKKIELSAHRVGKFTHVMAGYKP
jgi:hypothetical protein